MRGEAAELTGEAKGHRVVSSALTSPRQVCWYPRHSQRKKRRGTQSGISCTLDTPAHGSGMKREVVHFSTAHAGSGDGALFALTLHPRDLLRERATQFQRSAIMVKELIVGLRFNSLPSIAYGLWQPLSFQIRDSRQLQDGGKKPGCNGLIYPFERDVFSQETSPLRLEAVDNRGVSEMGLLLAISVILSISSTQLLRFVQAEDLMAIIDDVDPVAIEGVLGFFKSS